MAKRLKFEYGKRYGNLVAIENTNEDNYINWDILKQQTVVETTDYFVHVRFDKNLFVHMQGKERTASIYVQETE